MLSVSGSLSGKDRRTTHTHTLESVPFLAHVVLFTRIVFVCAQ